MENRLVIASRWGGLGWGKGSYGDKKATWEILVVLEMFNILIVIVDYSAYSDNKNYIEHIYTNEYK